MNEKPRDSLRGLQGTDPLFAYISARLNYISFALTSWKPDALLRQSIFLNSERNKSSSCVNELSIKLGYVSKFPFDEHVLATEILVWKIAEIHSIRA